MFGQKRFFGKGERKEEDKTPGGGSSGANKTLKNLNLKAEKHPKNSKIPSAFFVETSRSRNLSASSNDEGISKTPKNADKNPKNLKTNLEPKSIDSVQSAITNHQLSIKQFEEIAFQKRLFKYLSAGTFTTKSRDDSFVYIQINDIVLVEIVSLRKESFEDFLDECYDDDAIAKLVVFFRKSELLKTTFLTMDFGILSASKLSKIIGEQVIADNSYMMIDCSISTSDEDFSEDDSDDLIDID